MTFLIHSSRRLRERWQAASDSEVMAAVQKGDEKAYDELPPNGRLSVFTTARDSNGSIAKLDNEGADQPLALELKTNDAGYLARAFFGVDFIEGGILDLRGALATQRKPGTPRANT